MVRICTSLCAFVIVGVASIELHALTLTDLISQRLDPSLEYRTVITAHFHVHYPSNLESIANTVSSRAESVYSKTTDWFGSKPPMPTHVVLYEKADRPQIFAFTHPHRQIFFDVSLPPLEMGLNDYASWHDWLLTHEFSHIVQMESASPVYQKLSRVFGAWLKPNRAMPRWFKEGIAVRAETELTPRGRGDSTFYRSVLRAAVAENRLQDLDYVSPNNFYNERYKVWPWPNRGYLVGELLTRVMTRRTSADQVVNTIGRSAPSNLGPALNLSGFRDFQSLWNSALQRAQRQSDSELRTIRQQAVTPLEFLTDDGFWYAGLTLSRDGSRLLATRDGPQRGKQLIELLQSAGRWQAPRVLLNRTTGSQVSISNSGRFVALDQSFWQEGNYLISDITLYDLKQAVYVSQSSGLRSRDPDIHPDGLHIVYVTNEAGTNRLEESNSGFGQRRTLLDDVGYARISAPRYSPDGTLVAVSVHNEINGGEDLLLIDRKSGKQTIVIADGAANRDVSWTPDGDGILFASDRTGVFNVYRFTLGDRQIYQLTNVESAAHYPVVSPDAKWLYLLVLRSGGYDIARTSYQLGTRVEPARLTARVVKSAEPRVSLAGARHAYRPGSYMLPQYVQPQFLFREDVTQAGIRFGAVDPLYLHHYELEVRRDLEANKTVGELFYFNGASTNAYDFSILRDVVRIKANDQIKDYLFAELNADIFLNNRHTLYLRPGFSYQDTEFDGRSKYYGANIGLRYDTEFTQLGYSFPESGTFVDVDLSYFKGAADAPNHWRSQLVMTSHRPLSQSRHALHGKVAAAWVSDNEPNNLLGVGGKARFPLYQRNDIELFGYQPNEFLTRSIAVVGMDYTFPVKDIQRGWAGSRLTFGRLSASLRSQFAVMQGERKRAFSLGVELTQDIDFLSQLDLKASIGLYYARDRIGDQNRVVFTLTGLPIFKHKGRR